MCEPIHVTDLPILIPKGYGQFEAAAREDLVPLAEQLEEQMRPTLRTMHHELRGALGSLTDQVRGRAGNTRLKRSVNNENVLSAR